jgi:hypothetical protein
MEHVRRELRRDPESDRLWGVEVFDNRIIGCVGPWPPATFPPPLDEVAFERNGELVRWLDRRYLELARL